LKLWEAQLAACNIACRGKKKMLTIPTAFRFRNVKLARERMELAGGHGEKKCRGTHQVLGKTIILFFVGKEGK